MDPSEVYNKLREWQLARLRNIAKEGAEKTATTPASLIASDKEAIRELIKAASKPEQAKQSESRINLSFVLISWLLAQVLSGIVIASESGANVAISTYTQATLACLIGQGGGFESLGQRFAFFSFFILPSLLLLLVPDGAFRKLLSPRATGVFATVQKTFSSAQQIAAFIGFILAVDSALFVILPHSSQNIFAITGGITCMALSVSVFALRFQFCQKETVSAKLNLLQKEIAGDEAKIESVPLAFSVEKLELSMRELIQRERAIADFSKTVIVSFDKNMKVDAVSPSALMQWGYYQYEMLHKNFADFVFQEDLSLVDEALSKAKETGTLEVTARIRKKDNSIADYNWYIDWSPRLDRFFVACDDVTDRMMLERARNDFIAQLTHDMRSPIAAVVMTLALFSEKVFGELPTKVYESIDRAQSGLGRVLELINDILDTEKLHHNLHVIDAVHVDICDLCERIFSELQSIAVEKNVSFEFVGKKPQVMADFNLMTRVFSNLLSNALSFSPAGSKVKVEVIESSDSAIVRISDSGPGIHPDYQQMIFERYKTAKLVSSKRVSTGLGLWISREIVRAHGGKIGVESELGKGSTFWLSLPLSRKRD